MNSALNITKIVLLSIIAVALVFLLVVLLNKNIKFDGITLNEKTELIYDEVFKEDISNLDIFTTSSDVEIKENNKDEISVKIYDKKDVKPEVYVEGNTLNIINKKERKISFFIGIQNGPKMVISIPKSRLYNLNVEGDSADVTSSVNLKDVKVNIKSGDIDLLDSNNTVIKTTSGDIEVGSSKNLDINTTSGDIEANKISEVLKAKAVSGDIEINEVNGSLTLETKSGDIKVNSVNLNKDSSINVVSGDILIGKTNDIYVDASTVSGDNKVNVNNRHADYELKIKTVSGDIIVKN